MSSQGVRWWLRTRRLRSRLQRVGVTAFAQHCAIWLRFRSACHALRERPSDLSLLEAAFEELPADIIAAALAAFRKVAGDRTRALGLGTVPDIEACGGAISLKGAFRVLEDCALASPLLERFELHLYLRHAALAVGKDPSDPWLALNWHELRAVMVLIAHSLELVDPLSGSRAAVKRNIQMRLFFKWCMGNQGRVGNRDSLLPIPALVQALKPYCATTDDVLCLFGVLGDPPSFDRKKLPPELSIERVPCPLGFAPPRRARVVRCVRRCLWKLQDAFCIYRRHWYETSQSPIEYVDAVPLGSLEDLLVDFEHRMYAEHLRRTVGIKEAASLLPEKPLAECNLDDQRTYVQGNWGDGRGVAQNREPSDSRGRGRAASAEAGDRRAREEGIGRELDEERHSMQAQGRTASADANLRGGSRGEDSPRGWGRVHFSEQREMQGRKISPEEIDSGRRAPQDENGEYRSVGSRGSRGSNSDAEGGRDAQYREERFELKRQGCRTPEKHVRASAHGEAATSAERQVAAASVHARIRGSGHDADFAVGAGPRKVNNRSSWRLRADAQEDFERARLAKAAGESPAKQTEVSDGSKGNGSSHDDELTSTVALLRNQLRSCAV